VTPAEITQTDRLQSNQSLSTLVASKNAVLCEEVNLATAKAQWDLRQDEKQRPLLQLHITDAFRGEANKPFAPTELEAHYESHFRERLHNMKGAMLRIGEWRGRVDEFLKQIEVWSAGLSSPVILDHEELLVNEDQSGPYSIQSLKIRRGDRSVWVWPIATWVVGAEGRVDFVGVAARRTIVRDANGWQVVPIDYKSNLYPFDQNAFEEIVQALFQ